MFDDKLSGFGLRLRAGGKRTWIIQYRVGAKQRRKTLGSADKIRAAQAREKARSELADVQLGGDPQAKKTEQRARAAETLGAVAARYLRRQQGRLKDRSFEQVETHLTKHWEPLNGLSIHEITRRNVAAHLGEIAAERGPFAANRARTTLSGLFSWAMKEGLVDANPVLGTNRQADEQARDRVLSDAELVAVWNASRDDDYGRIVRLLILTGARRDEVGDMAKSEVDLGARKWSIPRERTKNGRAHEVPLSDLAIEILEPAMLREGREGRDLIFGDGAGGFSGWSKAKVAIDERIEKASAACANALALARHAAHGCDPNGRPRRPAACRRGGSEPRQRAQGGRGGRLQSGALRRREASSARPLGRAHRGDPSRQAASNVVPLRA